MSAVLGSSLPHHHFLKMKEGRKGKKEGKEGREEG
jgi:hypothetical protein